MTIRLVIVDDQELVRAGLRMVLGAHDDLEIVGEAADGEQALTVVEQVAPDVVLMDIRMPVPDGVEATRRLRDPANSSAPHVLVLTTFDLDEYAFEALRAGAAGFLVKDAPTDELAAAIRHVHAGDAAVAPSTTRRLIEHFTAAGPSLPLEHAVGERLHQLTAREHEVLTLLATGRSNAEIADVLTLSEVTIKTHVGRILTKLDLRDRTQAVIYAYETGVVRADRDRG